MTELQNFIFRNKLFTVEALFSFEADPCYIFCTLQHAELTAEFGDEVTIKTDCSHVLPRQDDYPALLQLREAIFDVVKFNPAFIKKKALMALRQQAGKTTFHPGLKIA